jgi:hypothetical protein
MYTKQQKNILFIILKGLNFLSILSSGPLHVGRKDKFVFVPMQQQQQQYIFKYSIEL